MIFKDTNSIYLQIAERICDEILQGQYIEEERIPSVREYATLVEVNVNTAMKSFDYLQSQNIIFNKRGLGYFVAPGAIDVIKAGRKKIFIEEQLPEFLRQVHLLDIDFNSIAEAHRQFQTSNSKHYDTTSRHQQDLQ